ncbi:hypothetical protein Tco_1569145 [Tanacetum coccineum]
MTTGQPRSNHRATVNTGQRRLIASQRSGQTVATSATWHATSACRSLVSLRGTATSADWIPLAYVAATSAVDVAEGILTLLQARTRDLEERNITQLTCDWLATLYTLNLVLTPLNSEPRTDPLNSEPRTDPSDEQYLETPPDHRSTTANGGDQRRTTGQSPVNHHLTTDQPSPDHRSTTGHAGLIAQSSIGYKGGHHLPQWMPTSACRSLVSLRGTATSADWIPLAYVAATSAADVAEGILTLLQARTRDLEERNITQLSLSYQTTAMLSCPATATMVVTLSTQIGIRALSYRELGCISDMSNSDELRHTDNTTLIPPRLLDTLPQVYHRRRPTLGLLVVPSVLPFPLTIRRTACISFLPDIDYQLDPVTPPPSPSSPFSMAAYQRMIAETDLTQREEALTAYGMKTSQGSVPVPETALTDRASNAQEEARHKRKEALEEVVQRIYRNHN